MTLSSTNEKLKKVSYLLNEIKNENTTMTDIYRIIGVNNIPTVINLLRDIQFPFEKYSFLSDMMMNPVSDNKINLKQQVVSSFFVALSSLKSTIQTVIDLLNKIIKPIKENTVFIKIVEPSDLVSLERNIEPFQKIFSQLVLHPDIGGEIIYDGVEPGSTWIKVILGAQAAVLLIGSVMWSAAVISKKFKEVEIVEKMADNLAIEAENKQTLVNANKILTNMMLQAEAQHIYNTYYNTGEIDHEQIGRIKVSIKELSEEINKGAEINPSLTAPEEVRNLFPDMKLLPTIQSKIPQIGNGNN